MELYLPIILSLLFCFIYSIIYKKKLISQAKENKMREMNLELASLDRQFKKQLAEEQKSKDKIIKNIQKEIEERKNYLNEIKASYANEKQLKQDLLNKELREWQKETKQSIDNDIKEYKKQKQTEIEKVNNEIAALQSQLDEFQQKQQVAAEQIIRQRELEEQKDFYRVVLSDESKADIKLLESIRQNLHNQSDLDKLIYDVYVSKPVAEMIKRVLKGRKPCGIYKITRSTGEVYIGKSTDVSNRWTQHCKSAFHCGTISRSTLHKTMELDGIDTFTFELLEEVDKDKLNEREKYWIQFFNSKELGLNEKL